jgi:alpha-methylacyl-CoA racemase
MGPLKGITVVEIASIGPGPFCAMILSDLGADVIRVDRVETVVDAGPPSSDPLLRGRRSIAVDLKHPSGKETVLALFERADAVVEGFRPGVVERLGIGPDDALGRNPGLIYGRMTGWGQEGPLSSRAGHDIDYIAIAGALDPIGPFDGPPTPPLNLVGDFGGGGMLLALGIAAALVERDHSGRGQVVDAAMVDGAALLSAMFHGMMAAGLWSFERGGNLLDGSAPFYTTYETRDGRYVAVGAIEPQFYEVLVAGLGLEREALPDQFDRDGWPVLRARFEEAFGLRTRDEWEAVFAGTDACVAPILGLAEAVEHPVNRARGVFVDVGGAMQPSPAPRFGRTPAAVPVIAARPGQHTDEILAEIGLGDDIDGLRDSGAVA